MNSSVKTVYIAGPITGDPHYREKFHEAEMALIMAGLIPLNPADIMSPLDANGVDYNVILACCLNLVKTCDAIAMMPGWRNSKGAKAELNRYCQSRSPWECVLYDLDMYPNPTSKANKYSTIITRYDGLNAWRNEHCWDNLSCV